MGFLVLWELSWSFLALPLPFFLFLYVSLAIVFSFCRHFIINIEKKKVFICFDTLFNSLKLLYWKKALLFSLPTVWFALTHLYCFLCYSYIKKGNLVKSTRKIDINKSEKKSTSRILNFCHLLLKSRKLVPEILYYKQFLPIKSFF